MIEINKIPIFQKINIDNASELIVINARLILHSFQLYMVECI